MNGRDRRKFLRDVGGGMLVASLGSQTAFDLGLSPAFADEPSERLTFGELEPLVSLMQGTPPPELLPRLVGKLHAGTSLGTLVSAAALANARAFGGQDYTGYHTFMALLPAYQMSRELSGVQQALPVLKVIYRNASRIHDQGAHDHDALHPVHPAAAAVGGEQLRDAVRAVDWAGAESQFAATVQDEPDDAFDALQYAMQDDVNVHRVVLAWRSWAMLDLAGESHAETLLRQSLRFCLDSEQNRKDRGAGPSDVRNVLPRLLDEHRLLGKSLGDRPAEDGWVEQLADTVYASSRAQAAEAVAAALSEGMDPEAIGEAISLAANRLVLHDPGRREEHTAPGKPAGCVHGDSVGVHASDSANAWRNIARASRGRNRVASLIVGAYHTAGQTAWNTAEPYPYAEQLDDLRETSGDSLLAVAEEAIRANDQARACAAIHRYGEHDLPARSAFDLLLKYAVSEDGALHAEKYYRTVSEEFDATRPAFRWRQLVALARVTASEQGYPAPGVAEARELLGAS